MKCSYLFAFLIFQAAIAFGQNPNLKFSKADVEADLKYLASDQLGGRRTGSHGEQMAADYITKKFAEFGVKTPPNMPGYIQEVPFSKVQPTKFASIEIGDSKFILGDNLLIINGKSLDTKTEVVFAGNGWVDEAKGVDDYKGLDVKGKLVVAVIGTPEGSGPNEVFASMERKQELAKERGAIALIEIYKMQLPWSFVKGYFEKERVVLNGANTDAMLNYGWILDKGDGLASKIKADKPMAKVQIEEGESKPFSGLNIVGVIEGTDKKLKEEYVVLSAHYDHVGIGKQGGAAYTPQDSIFNGARDNGIGTVALLAAAKELAANPPKRSILLLACTAEEMGMLGSAWFVEKSPIPLEQLVFNLNSDGAGYNSTEHVNLIGKDLTNASENIEKASSSVGLILLDDPAPEQNLYERSDNISFANKGIPAVDFAPGIKEMDETVFKYYHQAADNPDSIDYDYLLKFCKAFTLAARSIADKQDKLQWKGEGLKYAR